jgi:hypothetical protein
VTGDAQAVVRSDDSLMILQCGFLGGGAAPAASHGDCGSGSATGRLTSKISFGVQESASCREAAGKTTKNKEAKPTYICASSCGLSPEPLSRFWALLSSQAQAQGQGPSIDRGVQSKSPAQNEAVLAAQTHSGPSGDLAPPRRHQQGGKRGAPRASCAKCVSPRGINGRTMPHAPATGRPSEMTRRDRRAAVSKSSGRNKATAEEGAKANRENFMCYKAVQLRNVPCSTAEPRSQIQHRAK